MSSVLVINAAGRETRVALVENGNIAEFYLERKKDKGIVGNIYKGRVVRVLPGMQAAFVDIGLDKAAFLYVSDVVYDPDFARAQFELTEGEHEEVADVPEATENGEEHVHAAGSEASPPDATAEADHGHAHDDENDDEDAAFEIVSEPSITGEYAMLESEAAGSAIIDFEAARETQPSDDAGDDAQTAPLLVKESVSNGNGGDSATSAAVAPEARADAAAVTGAPAPEADAAPDAGTADAGEPEQDGAEEAAGDEAGGTADDAGSADDADGGEASAAAEGEASDDPDASDAVQAQTRDGEKAEGGEEARKGRRDGRRGRRRGNKGEIRGEKRTPRDAKEARQRDRGNGNGNGRKDGEKEKIKTTRETRIEDVLKVGQEVVVQISKDPIGTKGARLTSHISIPGRHLVFMPTVDHVGISRRIGNDKERKRLRDIVEKMRPPGTGFIVRTVAEGVPSEKLESDIRFLIEIWNQVVRKNERRNGPGLMHSDLDLILRATRDLFAQDVEKLVVDDREEYERILSFVSAQDANLSERVQLHDNEEPIFDAYGIEQELARATQRKVWLKSGGYLIIDQAEALTAIDVNSGRYVGKKSLEETITKINVEAAKEIVYQLRLRNIGGIIICDFIDMEKSQNRDKVFKSLQEALGRDKAKTNVLRISELGLVEMTRKRVRESIGRMLHEECAYCDGKGFVKTALTVAYEIFREIRREAAGYKDQTVVIHCSSEVARLLQGDERQELRHLMDRFNKTIQVRAQANHHREQYDIYGRTVQGNEYRITGSSGYFLTANRAEGHGDYARPESHDHRGGSNGNGGGSGRDRGRERGGRGGRDRNRGGGGGRKEGSAKGDSRQGRSEAPAQAGASKE
ncbi:MAG TPA: Rne/Rng family ribonuclease [Myxococcaceae bacterium]|nr:Rne/Rng family ribonuclease [Myxococcaceae bacterium]